ncbi:MAG: hypothetical protein K2N28_10810, partial [Muribaculaceae bacterium]|nr:hypothetical protein [Muribaculaceae bacterium]
TICMSTSCDEEYPVTVVNETDNDIYACLIQSTDFDENFNPDYRYYTSPQLIKAHNEIQFHIWDYILERKCGWSLMVIHPETFRENEFGDIWKNEFYYDIVKYDYRQVTMFDRRLVYKGHGQSGPSYRD